MIFWYSSETRNLADINVYKWSRHMLFIIQFTIFYIINVRVCYIWEKYCIFMRMLFVCAADKSQLRGRFRKIEKTRQRCINMQMSSQNSEQWRLDLFWTCSFVSNISNCGRGREICRKTNEQLNRFGIKNCSKLILWYGISGMSREIC